MSDEAAGRQLFWGRDLCEWALGLFRTVAAAGIIGVFAGGFAFFQEFEAVKFSIDRNTEEIRKGILPEARVLIARLTEIVLQNRRDIDRHERILGDD